MKNKKTPDIIVLIILTSVTLIFWTIVSIYNAYYTPAESNIDSNILAPLDPNLDLKTLQDIETRIYP